MSGNAPETTDSIHTLHVGGMTCNGCVRRVTDVLTQAGAREVQVSLEKGEARFVADAALVDAARARLDADGWDVGA